MARSVRWLVAVLGAAAAFGIVLLLADVVELSVGPRAEADRWVVAVGFGTAVSAAVLAWAGAWAGRADPGPERPASGHRDHFHNEGNVYQGPTHTGSGSQFNTGPDGEGR